MPTATTVAPARSTERTSAETPSEARARWPLERVLFLMAGTMTALSVVLAVLVSPLFLLLTLFVAVNQLAFVVFGNCPSSWLMRRYLCLRGAGEQPR
jgi:hypothetical protein